MTILNMPEHKPRPRVMRKGGATLEARVMALETALPEVHSIALQAASSAKTAADNTSELLAIANAAKGVGGFLVKHGPRMVAFGTGILATLGIGNPKVLQFVQNFFG